ncbi:MAG: hypothetical protein PHU85_00895, partial [Phycisphaerae bacterium]|nr:hypothetical protein [Phycisphaerae bacterium]
TKKELEALEKSVAGDEGRAALLRSETDKRSDLQTRKKARQFYRKLDSTEEFVENNYYHLPAPAQNAGLITVNAFWKEYAAWLADGSKGAFLSSNFAEASRNFAEIMFALSVLDLPFESGKPAVERKDGVMTLTADRPLIAVAKQIRPADVAAEAAKLPILVSQNFFRADDRYTQIDNERVDKYVTDEFLVQVVYGAQIVATNPTSARQKLDLLLQVPPGTIPVSNGEATKGVIVDLQPFATQRVEYYFYFPFKGSFAHFPVHVARNGKLVASAAAVTFNVVETPSKVDTTSWEYISQNGSADQVLAFLKDNNVNRLNLDKMAWRMVDKDFFAKAIALLDARHVYHNALWSYAVRHDDLAAMRQFLQHQDSFLAACGEFIDCKLVTIDPVVRKSYQHMEYSPLVNARAHKLGKARTILNDRMRGQYQHLLRVLAYRPTLDDDDLMSVTYYLLLQDRVEDGMAFLARVDAKKLDTQVQYDYFQVYVAFYAEKLADARKLAAKYADYPVDRWRKLFANATAQLGEIEGKTATTVADDEDRLQVQTRLAASEPALDLKLEDQKVVLSYQNLGEVRVNYYRMDIELMFSRNPFVASFSDQFNYIHPNATDTVKLPAGKTAFTFELPKDLLTSNVMVEVIGGPVRKSQVYFSNVLAVQLAENYGQLQVRHGKTDKPMAKVYVKVYARQNNGQVQFYKDGYTDLRGRFDYASLNTNELERVEKFSILVLSESDGAVIREAAPPKQ